MRHSLLALAFVACQSVSTPPAKTTSPGSAPAAAGGEYRHTAPQIVHAAQGKAVELRPGTPHIARAVHVGDGVTVEVLDWGGRGPALVLLAGLGNSAHIFDDLASSLVDRWRVLGVSRRGFGASTAAESGYDIPRLGSDILCVLDQLELGRAIFVGHSIAGEELTWLGSQHGDRVLGLVYLEAAYDRVALREHRPPPTPEPPATPADLGSPVEYAAYMSRGMGMPIPLDEVEVGFTFDGEGRFVGSATNPRIIQQIAEAVRVPDYAQLEAPTLALYAQADHWTADYAAFTAREREKFARALPSASVRTIPHAKHYLFLSHRAEVVRELRAFLTDLEPP
jgi:non-heme chloroperoxidase